MLKADWSAQHPRRPGLGSTAGAPAQSAGSPGLSKTRLDSFRAYRLLSLQYGASRHLHTPLTTLRKTGGNLRCRMAIRPRTRLVRPTSQNDSPEAGQDHRPWSRHDRVGRQPPANSGTQRLLLTLLLALVTPSSRLWCRHHGDSEAESSGHFELARRARGRWLRGLSNNGTASGDSELKTAGFVGGHQDPHGRPAGQYRSQRVPLRARKAEPTWMGTVALCLRGLSRSALRRRAGRWALIARSAWPRAHHGRPEAEAPGVPGDLVRGLAAEPGGLGAPYRFGAVVDLEFGEDVADVVAHGLG